MAVLASPAPEIVPEPSIISRSETAPTPLASTPKLIEPSSLRITLTEVLSFKTIALSSFALLDFN